MNHKKLLLTGATALLLVACSENNKKVIDTKPTVPVVRTNGLKIAFYNQDSLKTRFLFYKKMDEMVKNKQLAFQNQLAKKEKELEVFITTNEEKAKLGQLSGFELQSVQQEAQRKQQAFVQFQQNQGGNLEKETVDLLNVIGKKIEAAGKKYCEKHKIDILLVQAVGSQYNYITPTMDVTDEFISFLNQEQASFESTVGINKK